MLVCACELCGPAFVHFVRASVRLRDLRARIRPPPASNRLPGGRVHPGERAWRAAPPARDHPVHPRRVPAARARVVRTVQVAGQGQEARPAVTMHGTRRGAL